MARLIVNPGSPTQWEIPLQPGLNRIGRGFENDFKLTDVSVSGSHCQVIVEAGRVLLKDLGSTNGTFVNRAPVQEAVLQPGHTIHLGRVPMLFDVAAPGSPIALPAAPAPAPIPAVAAAPAPIPTAAPIARPAIAIARAAAPVAVAAAAPPMAAAPPVATAPAAAVGSGPCKYHPKTAGRYFCPQCRVFYCDLCVTTRAASKICRHCGAPCTSAQVQSARPASAKGFFQRFPTAFAYPFRGSGLLVLIVSTLVFTALNVLKGGLFGLFITIVAFGYLFSYMQNIIHGTANEEEQMPELPGFDDVFGGAFRLAVTILVCFGAPIAFFALKYFEVIDLPASAYVATMVLGCLYFPMAFLAVAMKDSVLACNPLVVFPAILKVPAGYLVTALVVMGVFGIRMLGDFVSTGAQAVGFATRDMSVLFITFGVRACWSLASVYLLTVAMRTLGLLYVTNKEKFGWFNH